MQQSGGRARLSTAERISTLSRVGAICVTDVDEDLLFHLVAETAYALTGASFAAVCLRSLHEEDRPYISAESHCFSLASVVGATQEQEAVLRSVGPGGEGILASLFRHGKPVMVSDILTLPRTEAVSFFGLQEKADQVEVSFDAAGHHRPPVSTGAVRDEGRLRGHGMGRSFLGVPLLDRARQMRAGLLLGHSTPDYFTEEDEAEMVGLVALAAVALEKTRWFRLAEQRARGLDQVVEQVSDGVIFVDQHGGVQGETEQEARKRATQLEMIFDAMTDAVFVYDASGHIIETNTAARDFWAKHLPAGTISRSIEERVTQMVLSATDGQPLAPERAPVSRALAGEVLTSDNAADLIFPSLEGREVCISVTGGPMRDADGTIIGAVSIVRDVTEWRSLERLARRVHVETRARESLLQLILDQLPSSVYLVRGFDARLVLANRAATKVWGKPWLAGQPLDAFLRVNGIQVYGLDGQPLAYEQLATVQALQQGEMVCQRQEIIRHADGTTLPVMVNALELAAPNLLRVLALAVAQPFERWEPVALVVHQDLTTLKEAEHLKDEFLSIAAHELRNPLAALKGYAHMLLAQTARGKGTPLVQWQQEALKEIDQATSRLDVLTEDLLDVTRLQAGQLSLRVEPVDLVALIRRIVARLQMTTKRHALSLHTVHSSLVVAVDPGRIEQVFANLIGNAIKYSPEGGLIKVSMRQKGETDEVLISVRDYGIGIPEQQQARIFGRFVRAQNAQMHGISGAGLGLYICRTLVELHGGNLWFQSAEEQGTTFFLTVPLLISSS